MFSLILLSITSSLVVILLYKNRSLKKEHEKLLNENQEEAKLLFLKSRYSSMGETVGNIAHQWKQPLNAIGAIQNSIKASLLFQGDISKEKLLNSVETSFKLLQHLAETIDTFYSFLSQRSNTAMSFNISDELDKVRKITEYSFQNSHIALNFDLEINPTIQGNANEFTHSMLNLILNAKDAFDNSPALNPTITVHVGEQNQTCMITVTDNAGGIRLDPMDMVFDMHITTKESGSGLGLFMTKKIIEQRFGGTITVENKDGGACFTITLPYSQYSENHVQTLPNNEKLSLDRINQLSRKVIELEEVEKTLQKWADIFKKAHWGIAIHVGTSNHFESTNDAFNTLYGYTPQELRKISVPDLFPPETLPILADVQQRAFKKGYAAFETINKRRDGSTFPVSVELIVAKDDKGEILYHMANIWDMSEKKAVEKDLLLLNKALNNTNEAVYITILGTIVQVNDGACKMLGYSREEFASMNITDIDKDVTPEDMETIVLAITNNGSIRFERKHYTKDGRVLDVEIVGNFFEHEDITYSFSSVRDITEQKKAREELLLKKFALNTINEAVFLIDKDSRFHYVNEGACSALGYTKEELVTMGVSDLDPSFPMEQWRLHWEDIKKQKTTLTVTQHQRKDGTLFPIEISSNYFEYNGVGYSLAVSRDITERLLLEKEKENRVFRSIAENIPDNIARWDTEGRYLYINPTHERTLGVTAADIIGKTTKEAFPDEQFAVGTHSVDQVLATGKALFVQHPIVQEDGDMGWHDVNYVPERDETGKIISVLGVGRDMTHIYRLQDELAKREQEFRALADTSPGMMGAFHMRPDGSMYMPYVSPNIIDIFGIEPHEVAKDAIALMALTHPDDAERIHISILESAHSMSIWNEEYRILHLIKGERWMESNTMPQPHPDGGIVWYGYVHDITERKMIEEELLEQNQFLDSLLNAIPVPVFYKDKETRYRGFNKAFEEFYGKKKEEMIGKGVHDLFPPEQAQVFFDADADLFRQGGIQIYEHKLRDNQGIDHDVIFHKAVYFDKRGEIIGQIGTILDITERKAMEDLLEKERKFLIDAQRVAHTGSWYLDIQNSALSWSDESYRIFELDKEHIDDLHKTFYERVHPEDREMVSAPYEESLKTKLPYQLEHRIVMDDGRIKYVIERCEHTYDDNGTPLYSIGTVQDITERKKSEDALRSALEFNEGIIGAIPDLLFEIAPDGTYVGIWAQNQELLAAQKELLLGKNFKEFLPPDVVITSFQAMKEVDETGASLGKTYSLDLPAGKRWFELSVTKKKTSGNYIVLSRDITERKMAEKAVRELNDTLEEKVTERTLQLQQLLDFNEGVINALPDLLFELNSSGVYLNVWARDEELLAAQKEILLGNTLHDVLSKEAADTMMDGLREAVEKGVSFGKIITIELLQGRRYFEQSIAKKASGNTFIVLSHDITERIEAEKALRQSEETFRAIVENSPDVIARYDLQMRRTYINPMMEFLIGKPLKDVLGKTPREFSPIPDVDVFEHLFDTVVQGKNEIEYEGVFTTPWGERRLGNQRIIPEFDEDRNVISMIVIGRDMTERAEAEKRLKMIEMAINSSAEAVYINNKELSIIYVNDEACRMLGYSRNELLSMKILEIDAKYTIEEIDEIIETKIREGKVIFETQHRKKDGSVIDVEVAGSFFIHEEDTILISLVKEIS